jgi:ABC-type transport system involved in multi-copper enzyme maturation permease subunit
MTTLGTAAVTPGPAGVDRPWWQQAEEFLSWVADRMNPILVKEARQALKSKVFTVTFGLVLAFAWGWSMLGVAIVGPSIYHTPAGRFMFAGYFVILAFPLAVIVPFTAFRSLAAEREDGTYELLSITALRPWQIISGKLWTSVLQMLVYFSAVAPCLGFTYMLRGIDFLSILFVLFYSLLASLALSALGLLLATVTRERHWQVVLSVFMVAALLTAFFAGCGLVFGFLEEADSSWFDAWEFWIANGAILTAYVSYVVFAICLAGTQLKFTSQNRSTLLRVNMLIQYVLFTGWMARLWFELDSERHMVPAMYMIFVSCHWYVMGAFLIGEWPHLSQRVRRALPQTVLARALFTWFNPGSGTGFMFAVANMASAVLVSGVALWIQESFIVTTPGWGGLPSVSDAWRIVWLCGCYVVIYLGVGRLLISLVRRVVYLGIFGGILVQVLVLLAGNLVPLTIHLMTPGLRDDYSLIEITNPFWTLAMFIDSGGLNPLDESFIMIGLSLGAAVFVLGNIPGIAREIRVVRLLAPARVAEEDAEIAARAAPPTPTRASPWDDDVPAASG